MSVIDMYRTNARPIVAVSAGTEADFMTAVRERTRLNEHGVAVSDALGRVTMRLAGVFVTPSQEAVHVPFTQRGKLLKMPIPKAGLVRGVIPRIGFFLGYSGSEPALDVVGGVRHGEYPGMPAIHTSAQEVPIDLHAKVRDIESQRFYRETRAGELGFDAATTRGIFHRALIGGDPSDITTIPFGAYPGEPPLTNRFQVLGYAMDSDQNPAGVSLLSAFDVQAVFTD
jgi:hypothetical protein